MGKNNSSEFRVKPTMEMIGNDAVNLKSLLDTLVLDGLPTLQHIESKKLLQAEKYYTGCKSGEIGLRPPKHHLKSMINDVAVTTKRKNFDYKTANDLIEKIYNTDKLVPKNIFILEGNTYPDLYIETDSYIIIAEGKWTEQNTTTKTTFLTKRNQMTRHIQCALEYAKGRRVYAFYMVDEEFLKVKKNQYITNIEDFRKFALDKQTITLTDKEKDVILECYKGYTTWQKVESIFPNINFPQRK